MDGLKQPFFEVHRDTEITYGGAQRWFRRKYAQKVGCGVIACTNILMQLGNGRNADRKEPRIILGSDYMSFAEHLRRYYLPLIPHFGLNGITLMLGMNFYFWKNKLPYRCYWGSFRKNFDANIGRMLAMNIPPVLAIGPNFPNFFGRHGLRLYRKEGSQYISNSEVKAHYVSVTGMDPDWYRISTWGKEMYISKREYREYIHKYSSGLFSNILVIKRKGAKK